LQVLTLLLLSVVLAVGSNALRSGGGLPWAGSQPEALVYRDIEWMSVEDAAPLNEDLHTIFLDARPVDAFERQRIYGALSLPADALDRHWAELRDFLTADMTLIVYADDPNLTVRTVEFLVARGLPARGLSGGWDAWRDARLPEERGNG
jgi:rhodanese-related sulfurtransferase